MIVNVLIVVTGGAVRLTGSGLGCPSWPNCAPGTFHTTAAMGIHGAIEWGNRLLGATVGFVAIAAFLAVLMSKPRQRPVLWLSTVVAIGVAAQGGIGAFTVGTRLAPWLVSVHFLVSIGVVTAALTAWQYSREPAKKGDNRVPSAVRGLWWTVTAVALIAITAGTVVSGSGPHAGDPDAQRLNFDPVLVSQAHADIVFLLLGLSIALLFTLHATDASSAARCAAWILLIVELSQGLIGMVQYFTGLPEILVGAHMLGAALLWIAVLLTGFQLRTAPKVGDPQRSNAQQSTRINPQDAAAVSAT